MLLRLYALVFAWVTVAGEPDDAMCKAMRSPDYVFNPASLKKLIPQHNRLETPLMKYRSPWENESWGQASEDISIYRRFFTDKKWLEKGFFLEMGGLDGATFSNSFLYELKLGWKGMLIEGNADNFKTMVQTRPCVNNVWAAACPAKQSHLYMTDGAGTASTRSFSSNVLKVLTPCRTLKSLFEEYGIDTIDFFSLDVESAELDVLRTIDFSRVKINVLIFELDKLSGGSNSNNNGFATNSTDSALRHVAIHHLLTAAGMVRLASDAKDMPACIPAERRYSIHGSAVYVSPGFRDDICPPDAKVAMGPPDAMGAALVALTDMTAAAIAAKKERMLRKQLKMQRKKNQVEGV